MLLAERQIELFTLYYKALLSEVIFISLFSSYEKGIEAEYDSMVKRALGNERKNFFRDRDRLLKKQIAFIECDDGEVSSFIDISASEAFTIVEAEFQVLKYSVAVRDALLYEALSKVGEIACGIILMAFWLDMTDSEISEETGIPRRKVNRIKHDTYAKLKFMLEKDDSGIFSDTNSNPTQYFIR